MTDDESDHQRSSPQQLRIGSLSSFLPSPSDLVSTRGQRLPSILRDASNAGLQNVRAQIEAKRQSVSHYTDVERNLESNGGAHADERSRLHDERESEEEEEDQTPQSRSKRLIGQNNPRYQWEKYYKSEEELKQIKNKPVRQYYEKNNHLICSYLYIDRLLNSSLPHTLIQEYHKSAYTDADAHVPAATDKDGATSPFSKPTTPITDTPQQANGAGTSKKVKRTPKALYKLPDDETTPLLPHGPSAGDILASQEESSDDADSRIVSVAIYVNLAANTLLLIGKIIVMVLTSSLSVLASLVDAALDFLSTAIVWTTTKLTQRNDHYRYPVGRRRLEPLGVLVFSVIMITSFFQVALECFQKLTAPPPHDIVTLGLPSILIMASTVVIKLFCWFWCRLVKNSSVQALAQDAATDVVFNIFSIIFPLLGSFFGIWFLDALGGLLLSLYVIFNWSLTSTTHIKHLTGASADPIDRNILLYLTMRFASTIQKIQGIQAYYAGDKLNVEVDVVVDEGMRLRDSHDLGESLQYVLESVPSVERAFVHLDYWEGNLPGHMEQTNDAT